MSHFKCEEIQVTIRKYPFGKAVFTIIANQTRSNDKTDLKRIRLKAMDHYPELSFTKLDLLDFFRELAAQHNLGLVRCPRTEHGNFYFRWKCDATHLAREVLGLQPHRRAALPQLSTTATETPYRFSNGSIATLPNQIPPADLAHFFEYVERLAKIQTLH